MRIGLDLTAAQAPENRARGIGRYVGSLAAALAKLLPPGNLFLYTHASLPPARVVVDNRAQHRVLTDPTSNGNLVGSLDRLVESNPDRLDAFLVGSPFESAAGFAPPDTNGAAPALFAIVYDLIPQIFQDEGWYPRPGARDEVVIRRLKRYRGLLAISESTRRDVIRVLGVDPTRVVAIGAADGVAGSPSPASHNPDSTLARFGIRKPFVFSVPGMDPRKNLEATLGAFARLPDPVRSRHQLVLTCRGNAEEMSRVRKLARARSIQGSLVLTGELDDDSVALLYRECAAFVMTSYAEGFGLPALEAMRAGAPCLLSRATSLPEVGGEASLYADPADEAQLSAQLATILTDPDLAASLSARGRARAQLFSWEAVGRRTIEAIHAALSNQPRISVRPAHPKRPRLACFSPLPPARSGIADYTERLLLELEEHYEIDLFHDPAVTPHRAWRTRSLVAPASIFSTLQPRRNYQAILYQMGNSRYHRFLYPYLLQHPGITTLHDLSLADFQLDRMRSSTDFRAAIHEALVGDGATTDEADDLTRDLLYGTEGAAGFISSCLKRGYALNSSVVDASLGIIVHSNWSADRLKKLRPEAADRIHVLPIGSEAHATSPQERYAAKVRSGLPTGSLICGCFGFLDPSKQNVETIQAFASLARSQPDALLLFIGQELDDGLARREAERLELGSRVRFLGRQPDDAYRDLLAATDIGIVLRRPPTKGETSAALVQLLGHGVPTIVSRVDTFGDVDPKVVHFVEPGPNLVVDLAQAIQELAESPDRRAELSSAGADLVRIQHDWKLVASTYRAHIDRIIEMNRFRTHRPIVHGAAG